MIVVTGHFPGMPFLNPAWGITELIPYGGSPSILSIGSLHLVSSRGCAPKKVSRESLFLFLRFRIWNVLRTFSRVDTTQPQRRDERGGDQ